MIVPEVMGFGSLDQYNDLGALGAREFWIFDEEETEPNESNALVRASCPPMLLSPGFKVVAIGAKKGQYPMPIPGTTEQVPYKPGFLSPAGQQTMAGLGQSGFASHGSGSVLLSRAKDPIIPLFDLSGLSDLGFFSIVSPQGAMVAAFRCRPFYVFSELAVTQSAGAFRTLIQRGAAESPEGTTRLRMRSLHTVRR